MKRPCKSKRLHYKKVLHKIAAQLEQMHGEDTPQDSGNDAKVDCSNISSYQGLRTIPSTARPCGLASLDGSGLGSPAYLNSKPQNSITAMPAPSLGTRKFQDIVPITEDPEEQGYPTLLRVKGPQLSLAGQPYKSSKIDCEEHGYPRLLQMRAPSSLPLAAGW